MSAIPLGCYRIWQLMLVIVLSIVGIAIAREAQADEPRDILLKVIQAGDAITAGEVTITFRGTRDLDNEPKEGKVIYVDLLAFDRPAKLLRWSASHPNSKRNETQDIIATPLENYYQQHANLRIKLLSPKQFDGDRGPIDARVFGRAPLKLVEMRNNPAQVSKFFEDATLRDGGRLPEDGDTIARIVYEGPISAFRLPDKTLTRYQEETRYRIDTKRNVILNIQYVGIYKDTGTIKPLHEDRFTWQEIDGILVPTKCERREETRILYDYVLDWKSVNKVDKARFEVDDLPPYDRRYDTIYIDQTDRSKDKLYKKGTQPEVKPRPSNPEPLPDTETP